MYIYLFTYTFFFSRWVHLEPEVKRKLLGLDLDVVDLVASLLREDSVSVLNGKMRFTFVDAAGEDDDDFLGLSRLFYHIEGYVDWRVRLSWIQTSMGTSFYIGEDLIFKSM